MEFNREDFKIIRVIIHLNRHKITLISSGVVSRVNKWRKILQQIISGKYQAHKTVDKAIQKAFKSSVYSRIAANLMNGSNYLLHSSAKDLKLAMKKSAKKTEAIRFKIFILRLHNRAYTTSQLVKFESSMYETNKATLDSSKHNRSKV